jgi:glycosyltransferase involved in cell wall biosynthesis
MKEKISAFVITKNEENKIFRCLEHLTWADEIVVLDSYSTDKTEKIAKKYTKKVYKRKFSGYGEQKQAAIDRCTNIWILEVDADEIITKELRDEIVKLQNKPKKLNKHSGYKIKRKEFFLGKEIMTSKILRLYRKDRVRYKGLVHEQLELRGKTKTLNSFIIHESDKYETIQDRIKKSNKYATIEVKKKIKEERFSQSRVVVYMIFEPIIYATWLYIMKGLWKRGIPGLIWSLLAAQYHFLIYAKYYEHIYIGKINPNNK